MALGGTGAHRRLGRVGCFSAGNWPDPSFRHGVVAGI